MSIYQQEPPFAVQIELVEGCNLRCAFCGLSGIRGRDNDYKFMTEVTLSELMHQIVDEGWNPRVEFAVHGEPTMHPDYVGMIALARQAAPRLSLMMTSNGGGLLRKPGPVSNVLALFHAGLSTLALDDYEGVGIVPKIRRAWNDGPRGDGAIRTYEYPEEDAGNPHRRTGERRLVFIADISRASRGTHAALNNHAGAGAPPLSEPMRARCAKPFRELTVRHDGSVAICCNDWRGEYKCGNVISDGLLRVWRGAAMDAARRRLIRADRDFGPCRGCDAVSYRVGLLPDKMGKAAMPPPDAASDRALARAVSGAPYTAPVMRDWE